MEEKINVLVYGLGISGLSAIKALSHYNCNISLLDSKSEEDLKDDLIKIKDIKFNKFLDGEIPILNDYDYIVKSPGIPPNNKILKKAERKNINILSDLELGYRLTGFNNTITITGTNGKTTTTNLINHIIKNENKKTNMIGNIGKGILDIVPNYEEDEINIIEASSFQLESTYEFRSKVSIILNISPDHLDWHGNFDNYIKSKLKILSNQIEGDFSILNYDDKTLKNKMKKDIKSNIIWFSSKKELENGIYIKDDYIIISEDSEIVGKVNIKDIDIIKENLLAAVGACYYFGISLKSIESSLKTYIPLEHRMEYIDEINGRVFYNDSKGTNPEATVEALNTIEGETILIAGGYDKGSNFDYLTSNLERNVELLILMGETKDKIKNSAFKNGFKRVLFVDDMETAVQVAWKNSKRGVNILLSPACASWGMYKNFEERGRDFKDKVKELKVKYDEEDKF